MTPRTRIGVIVFGLWLALVLAGFTLASRVGYALFATSGEPSQEQPGPDQRHK